MIRKAKDLHGYAVHASDGPIGHVKDLYFDDEGWAIRYLVVETGSWLSSRKVLISPIAIGQPDEVGRVLPVSITMDQVKNSPNIDTQKPVSRQHEMQYFGYYGYPYYWLGSGLWGGGLYPGALMAGVGYGGSSAQSLPEPTQAARDEAGAMRHKNDDPHLRSAEAILMYQVEATDGALGHIQELLVDDSTWAIRYIAVKTGPWWSGHEVLIAPQWITDVHWVDRTVSVKLTQKSLRDAPSYDSSTPLDRDWETNVYRHHGQPAYWRADAQSPRPRDVLGPG